MENTFEVIEHLANNAREKLSEKQTLSFQLRKETEEQKPKIQRVTKQCGRLRREIRILRQTNDETLEEQDIQLREIIQFHKDIDQMLVNAMENAEIHVLFQTYFQQNGLELPTAKGPSSRSSSQSSLSSVRSLEDSIPISPPTAKVIELKFPGPPARSDSSRSSSGSNSNIPKGKKLNK